MGINAFVNQRGDVVEATERAEQRALRQTLAANTTLTFYAVHGDYIAKIAVIMAIFLLLTIVGKAMYRRVYTN